MKWYEIDDHPNRCIAYGNLDGDTVINIQAKVWRMDDGSWGYAANSNACKIEIFCGGRESNRALAIKAVMKNLKEEFKCH